MFDLCSLPFLLFLPCPVRNGVCHMFQVIPASQAEATRPEKELSNNSESAECSQTRSPESNICVEAHFPEFLAVALRTRWIVTEDIDDVVETSRERVQTAELVPGRLQHLRANKGRWVRSRGAAGTTTCPTCEKTGASWCSVKHRSDKHRSLQLWMSASSSRGHLPGAICENSPAG